MIDVIIGALVGTVIVLGVYYAGLWWVHRRGGIK